ncbi:hypothetical protein D8M15_10015 [Micrococcus sp. HSID17228]|nr:hypothetical protein D8M15_10015 [Micrococcus sp. HSID17228]
MDTETIFQAIGQGLHTTTATRQSRKGEISTWKAHAPAFAAGEAEDGTPLVKLSAAWLIDRAGFAKGFGLPEVAPREGGPDGRGVDGTGLAGGRASVSTKHTLAMTNRGDASTEDVLTIARTVRDGVRERFGVELHPEPMIIGTSL